jgi:hypothetical protein
MIPKNWHLVEIGNNLKWVYSDFSFPMALGFSLLILSRPWNHQSILQLSPRSSVDRENDDQSMGLQKIKPMF